LAISLLLQSLLNRAGETPALPGSPAIDIAKQKEAVSKDNKWQPPFVALAICSVPENAGVSSAHG
jgi:hypothetical protein